MTTINPQSFPGRMLPPLDELAHQLLALKQYRRLQVVAELLALFSNGAWDQIDDEAKQTILEKLERDFHMRAWDDWDWNEHSAFSQIHKLVEAQSKAIRE